MYADYPIAFDTPEAIKIALNASRDMLLNRGKGKLVDEKEYFFKKYPGRELRANLNVGAIRIRMSLVQQRLYMLFVLTQGTDDLKPLETEAVHRFLDSFQLIDDPPPIPSDITSISKFKSAFVDLSDPPDFRDRPISWREVPWPELGFTIWMPGEPVRKTIPFNPKDQRLDFQIGRARGKDSICFLLAQQLLSAPSGDAARTIFFKSFIDSLLSGMTIKLEEEKTISFEGQSGREYKISGKLGSGLCRLYILGTKIYCLLGISLKDNDGSAEIARFFDSFRLTKNPDPAPAAGSVSLQSATLREFSEPGHGFKVLIPGEPKRESTSIQGVSIYTMVSAGDGIVCVVSRQRNPMRFDSPSAIDTFYKAFMDSYTKSSGFEIAGQTTIVLDTHQGREYKLKKNEATGTARVFLIDRDGYSVSAIAVLPGVSNESILKILNSFKLIEKSPKDEFDDPPPPPPPPPRKP